MNDITVALALRQEPTCFCFTTGHTLRPEVVPEAMNALRLFGKVQLWGFRSTNDLGEKDQDNLRLLGADLKEKIKGMALSGEIFSFAAKMIDLHSISVVVTREQGG